MGEATARVYDAENMVAGRLASRVAKAVLLGNNAIIVNAEKAIITGDRHSVINAFKRKHSIRTSYNPKKGPNHQRRPDKLLRKMIRGMLPWPTPRGKAAFKRIRVYIGVPKQYSDTEKIILGKSTYKSLKRKYITIEELSYELGWRSTEVN
ncbi:MAG: 50S ribosomal protein L13 [Candidatus Thorarchaeota archaeon]|jgi:large subunit ribosomal protein L13